MTYNPYDNYWIVGGDKAQVYSSARGVFVLVSDEAYVAWLAAGGVTTQIADTNALGEILSPYLLRPTDQNVLGGYLEVQAASIMIKVPAKVLANIINRIQVLEGKQPFTAAQFKTFVKGIL